MLAVDFALGVRASHVPATDSFEVFCNHCNKSIGTMSLNTVREAIFNTVGRAGILCPGCRKHTCDGCGAYFAQKIDLEPVMAWTGKVRLCLDCHILFTWPDAPIVQKHEELIPDEVPV